jgi:hypothetical protein
VRVHYSGGLKTTTARGRWQVWLRGYPVCTTGERAEEIAHTPGRHSADVGMVTCGTCLRALRRAGRIALWEVADDA